jgi:hypothetical protein
VWVGLGTTLNGQITKGEFRSLGGRAVTEKGLRIVRGLHSQMDLGHVPKVALMDAIRP